MHTRDGRALHVERRGQGEPVVVFESGNGASRNMWGAVVPAVAARTTAVVYDRSGLGRSAPDSAPRTLDRLADDLLDLVGQVSAGPVVLVGHSWGGPIVRTGAARRPAGIAGLVLVDQTDEGCDLFFAESARRQTRAMMRVAPLLARLGVLRLVARRVAARLPEPEAAGMRREDGTVAATRTQLAELAGYLDDLRRLRDEPLDLPDVPVSVISGTKAGRFERARRDALVAAHRVRADALAQGRHVAAERSGHLVPMTEPALVAGEVLRIVDLIRAR